MGSEMCIRDRLSIVLGIQKAVVRTQRRENTVLMNTAASVDRPGRAAGARRTPTVNTGGIHGRPCNFARAAGDRARAERRSAAGWRRSCWGVGVWARLMWPSAPEPVRILTVGPLRPARACPTARSEPRERSDLGEEPRSHCASLRWHCSFLTCAWQMLTAAVVPQEQRQQGLHQAG